MKIHVETREGTQGNGLYNPRYEQALVPQDKAMNDSHLAELKQEWLLSHGRVPFKYSRNQGLMQQWEQMQQAKAEAWARANEPKRFLNPLLRPMNGIPSDKELRRTRGGATAKMSSSWIGDGSVTANGNSVTIQLPPSRSNPTGKYTYGTTPMGLREFYSSPSLGKVISDLSRANPGTTMHGLTKLWETRDRFEHRSNRGWTGDYKHGDFKTGSRRKR